MQAGNFLFISVDPATSHINTFRPVIEGVNLYLKSNTS